MLAADARRAANEGRLSEALKDCNEAIAADKLSADYRYLQATILGELDRDDDAVKALNSTLYLDPRFCWPTSCTATSPAAAPGRPTPTVTFGPRCRSSRS